MKNFIFFLCLLLLICASFITPEETVAEAPSVPAFQCSDSDGGISLNVKGTINITDAYGDHSTIEECIDENVVNECYCTSLGTPENNAGKNQLGTYACRLITCPHGCQDGACITSLPGCYDSDGGKDYFTKGYVSDGVSYYFDECVDNNVQVHEGYCEDDQWRDEVYSCPLGCRDGACVAEETEKSIRLISPNGSEQWAIGETHNIVWEALGLDGENLRISVMYGPSGYTLAQDIPVSAGSWPWTIETRRFGNPTGGEVEFSTGDNVKIYVNSFSADVHDGSDQAFSIIEGTEETPTVCPSIVCDLSLCPLGCAVDANGCVIGQCGLSGSAIGQITSLQFGLGRQLSQQERGVVEAEKQLVTTVDKALTNRVMGRILLQVEEHGEAWYVDPVYGNKYYMRDGAAAYDVVRTLGLGITSTDLEKIPIGIQEELFHLKDTDGDGLADNIEVAIGLDKDKEDSNGNGLDDMAELLAGYRPDGSGRYSYNKNLATRLKGRVLLQVEDHGEAWYVNPEDGKRYYLGDAETAYNVMRFLSLGITNNDLRRIRVGELE